MNIHNLTTHSFQIMWDLGYRRLVPIIPPGAPISDKSNLAKRIAKGDDARGKVPGIRWPDGTWSGFDFVRHESVESDLAKWSAMGAGVGVKTGNGLVLIDADTKNPELADKIQTVLNARFGDLPIRIGNFPKAGYLVRTDADFTYQRIEFGSRNEKGLLTDRVEILAEGRQFVAHGIHPATLRPYVWPAGVPSLADVPFIAGPALTGFLEALRPLLPAAGEVVREGALSDVDQDSLRAPIELVEKAVKATPNTSALFPSRESYRDFGYAIKAAAGEDGWPVYLDWCLRWEDGENDPDVARADWDRMKPPYRRGASWLFEVASEATGQDFAAAQWFEPVAEPLFPVENGSAEGVPPKPTIKATAYSFPEPSAIPTRKEIYGRHYYRKFISATVAPSGVGKSSLEIVEALAMASNKPLLGVQPKGHARVWMWNGEDPRDELERRIAAAMMHYGLTREDIGDRLFVDTGREMEMVLAMEGRDGARISAPVVEAVVATMRENRIDVFQVDPFVSSHRVSENDNGAIDLVTKQWAKIADRTGAAIELVHHVRKLNGGEITVEDSRGAVSLLATSRSARALTRMSKGEAARLGVDLAGVAGTLFRFGDGKNNLAPPMAGDDTRWFRTVGVSLGNGRFPVLNADAEGSEGAGGADSDSVGVVTVYALSSDVAGPVDGREKAAALALIGAGEWKRDVRAGDAWVGVAIAQAFELDLDDQQDKGRARQIVKQMLKEGDLVEDFRPDKNRNMRCYITVKQTDCREMGAFD